MVLRNPSHAQLQPNYLFVEIKKKKAEFLAANPGITCTDCSVGNTTQPFPEKLTDALAKHAKALSTKEGYRGYGSEIGDEVLRELIAEKIYKGAVSPDEIFVSDGAKCDLGRLQCLFGPNVKIAIQDPAYPVYIDGSRLNGVSNIQLMPCDLSNGYFPDLSKVDADLIYCCSPNNPTGYAASRDELKRLVDHANKTNAIILFDAAYSHYITESDKPRSIFEIEGAKTCAIEMNSFSKFAGFTGLRLGFTVVPKELKYTTGESVHSDWRRVHSTLFNGASNISQQAGISALSDEVYPELKEQVALYMERAHLLKAKLVEMGFKVYGGVNAPYLWVQKDQMTSVELFDLFLNKWHVLGVPGVGFGPSGKGALRLSCFADISLFLETDAKSKLTKAM